MFVQVQKYNFEDNPRAKDNVVQTGNPNSHAAGSTTEQTSGRTAGYSTPIQRHEPGRNGQKLSYMELCVVFNLQIEAIKLQLRGRNDSGCHMYSLEGRMGGQTYETGTTLYKR